MRNFLPVFAAVPVVVVAQPAAAHFGHLGELAGHGHWVGAAAVLGAAALAAAAARRRRRSGEIREDDAAEDQPDAPAETARG